MVICIYTCGNSWVLWAGSCCRIEVVLLDSGVFGVLGFRSFGVGVFGVGFHFLVLGFWFWCFLDFGVFGFAYTLVCMGVVNLGLWFC